MDQGMFDEAVSRQLGCIAAVATFIALFIGASFGAILVWLLMR